MSDLVNFPAEWQLGLMTGWAQIVGGNVAISPRLHSLTLLMFFWSLIYLEWHFGNINSKVSKKNIYRAMWRYAHSSFSVWNLTKNEPVTQRHCKSKCIDDNFSSKIFSWTLLTGCFRKLSHLKLTVLSENMFLKIDSVVYRGGCVCVQLALHWRTYWILKTRSSFMDLFLRNLAHFQS